MQLLPWLLLEEASASIAVNISIHTQGAQQPYLQECWVGWASSASRASLEETGWALTIPEWQLQRQLFLIQQQWQ